MADAYGWDAGLPEETILQRLVDLNAERRAEEEEGRVRYLRPDRANVREEVVLDCAPNTRRPRPSRRRPSWSSTSRSAVMGAPAEPLDWPSGLKPRAQAVRAVMTHAEEPLTVEQVAQHFHRARRSGVRELLETLAVLGHVEETYDGAYVTNKVKCCWAD